MPDAAVLVGDLERFELSDDMRRGLSFLIGEFGVAVEPAAKIANISKEWRIEGARDSSNVSVESRAHTVYIALFKDIQNPSKYVEPSGFLLISGIPGPASTRSCNDGRSIILAFSRSRFVTACVRA
jgi:hypothetical protein